MQKKIIIEEDNNGFGLIKKILWKRNWWSYVIKSWMWMSWRINNIKTYG